MYSRCQKCGKKLSDPDSMLRGYGPECWNGIIGKVVKECKETEDAPIPGQMSIYMFPELLPETETEEKNGR